MLSVYFCVAAEKGKENVLIEMRFDNMYSVSFPYLRSVNVCDVIITNIPN